MSKFDLLIRLATDRLDAAADRMRKAQAAQQQAENTLLQVKGFIQDYQQRMLQQGQAGTSVAQWADFRLFMQKLDDALEQQQREVDRAMQRFLMEKQAWLQQRKQLKSYEVLQEREKARLALKQRRQEQKALDEFAARRKPE
ncbi:flagellar export protein FliJ [Vogesella urethralis]|jgi:flagellar FliJ protein|uniref:flagellar export protein FliJ n=1 Tax=Vogesella urethralis TaxID=2592656 RepID=UPI001185DE72|nr:flagellar export protein FliJ [Vogesella urethralis]MEC5208253.1 flagellar FliJ protein [Vogesella perlucida]